LPVRALPHHERQHDEHADQGNQGTRQGRDRIEPVIPSQVSFHPAHWATPLRTSRPGKTADTDGKFSTLSCEAAAQVTYCMSAIEIFYRGAPIKQRAYAAGLPTHSPCENDRQQEFDDDIAKPEYGALVRKMDDAGTNDRIPRVSDYCVGYFCDDGRLQLDSELGRRCPDRHTKERPALRERCLLLFRQIRSRSYRRRPGRPLVRSEAASGVLRDRGSEPQE